MKLGKPKTNGQQTSLPILTEAEITNLSLTQLQQRLNTSGSGLSSTTVKQRLSEYVYNELPFDANFKNSSIIIIINKIPNCFNYLYDCLLS